MRETEDNIIHRVHNNPEIGPVLSYGEKMEKPHPQDFDDVYDSKEIEKDLRYLKFVEAKMEDSRERSKALEIIIADQIYDGEWLGPDALASLTSRYDDIVNGVDLVVEFEREKIAFAIDASMNTDISEIKKKIEKNVAKVLDTGCSIKYFQSQKDDYKGGLKELIPVVVGADNNNANDLFRAFSELKSLEEENKDEMKNRRKWLRTKLCETPLQDIFLQQIKIQLEMYMSFLEDGRMKEQCERVFYLINSIIEEKEDKLYETDEIPSDEVFDVIEKISRAYF